MSKQVNLTLVVFASLIVVAVMLFITGTPYQSPVQASQPQTASSGQTLPVQIAQNQGNKPGKATIVSPVIGQMNPTQFLNPLPVGKKVPEFVTKDANGKPVKLSQFTGKKNVVVIFYSGSKCPICGQQLENLQTHIQDFKKQEAEILAISADDTEHAKQSIGEHGLSFTVIPDANKEIIKLFGVANITYNNTAWPASFVIDKKGIVRMSVADPSGKRLHSNELLPALSKITGTAAPNLSYEE